MFFSFGLLGSAAPAIPFTNQAPSFSLSSDDVSSLENAGPITLPNFLTELSAGPASEAKQALSFVLRVETNSSGNVLFTRAPALVRKGDSATLSFTTAQNSYGTNRITIILKDSGGTANGGLNTSTNSFDLRVAWVDQPPKFGALPNVSILENCTTNKVVVRVFDVDTPRAALSLSARSTNLALLDVFLQATNSSIQNNLALGTNAVDFTLGFTDLVANANGRTTIQLVASDGEKSTTNYLNLTVVPVNQAPTFTLTTNLVLACENAGVFNFTNLLTSLSPGPPDESRQSLSFTIFANTNAGGNLVFSTGPKLVQKGTNANLIFAPATNCYGTNVLTLIVKDGGDAKNGGVNAVTNQFTLGVFWTNQPPRLSSAGKMTILENVTNNTATIRVFDVDTPWTNLSLGAVSTNPSLVQVSVIATNRSTQSNLLIGTNAADFTVAFIPASNAVGVTTINLEASDGERLATGKFIVTVNPVNQSPSYALTTNLVLVPENSGPLTVTNLLSAISAGVNETKQTLTLAVTTTTNRSTNAFFSRLPDLTAKGSSATLNFTTASNAFGTNTITVVLKDNGGTLNGGINAFTNSFELGVYWVNQPPRMGNYTNRTVLENSSTNVSLIRVFDVDTPWTNLSLIAWPSRSDLVDVSVVAANSSIQTNSLIGTNAVDFTLAIVPKTNAVGTTRVTLAATDGQLSVTNNFTLSILGVNQAPGFNLTLSSFTVDKFGVPCAIPNAVTNVWSGADNEANQAVILVVSNSNPGAFLVQPSIAPDGTLTFTPGAQPGNVTVSIIARDNGGRANGGRDTSDPQSLTIVIPDNPFASLQGNYSGLFFDTNTCANESSGYFQMTLSENGIFSGYILCAGGSNVFQGQFGLRNPTVDLELDDCPCALNLSVDTSTNSSQSISGFVSDDSDGWEATLLAFLNVYSTNSTAPLAGQYLVAVPGNTETLLAPSGDSLLSLNIASDGSVAVQAMFADDTISSQETMISRAGQLPLYLGLGATGSMSGWLTITNTGDGWLSSDSSLVWVVPSGGLFPSGFTNTSVALGSSYDSNAVEVLAIASGTVVLSGGDLGDAVTNSVSISNNLIVVDPASTNGLSLEIDVASGRIEGQFVSQGINTNLIHGLVLPSLNCGRGYFVGTNQVGSFLLFGN